MFTSVDQDPFCPYIRTRRRHSSQGRVGAPILGNGSAVTGLMVIEADCASLRLWSHDMQHFSTLHSDYRDVSHVNNLIEVERLARLLQEEAGDKLRNVNLELE